MDSNKHTFQEIARLILLNRYGKAEKSQIIELQKWLKESEENRNFYNKVLSRSYLEEGLEEYMQYDADDAWKQLKTKMHPRKKQFFVRSLPYAAIVAVIVGLTVWFQDRNSKQDAELQNVVTNVILPGSPKAQLVLSDGRQIELEAKGKGLCRRVEGENFENNGQLLDYRQRKFVENTVQVHTLRIPRGGEYQIILSDSTRVWVNADSELQYPDRFTGEQRKVVLKGEAYFEVVRDEKHPFKVTVHNVEVEVLGTSFNINAYPERKEIQTTLAQGKVSVTNGKKQVVLTPGEQAICTDGDIRVREVDVGEFISWKNGLFMFNRMTLKEIMMQMERWYGLHVIFFSPDIETYTFTGVIDKNLPAEETFKVIEKVVDVHFTLKDKNVVITKLK